MTTRNVTKRAAFVLAALGAALSVRPVRPAPTEPQLVNKLAVRRVEIAQRLDASSLAVRLHLETGQAVDFEVSEPFAVDSLRAMTQAFASRGAHLFAEMENGRVRAVHISVP